MLKKIFLSACIAATLACQASPRVNLDDTGDASGLKPDIQQSIVTKNLVALLEKYHYKKVPLNDSLSGVILDRFIKSLDQNKNYFLASDIKDFNQYRTTLDDDLKDGDLTSLFRIFNVFQQRYTGRINYSISQLNKPFTFNSGTYSYNREDLPWLASQAASDSLWTSRVEYDLLNLRLANTDKGTNKNIPIGTKSPDATDTKASSDETKNIQTLKKRYENLLAQSKKINNQDAFQIMMDAFTESIDPHTNYFVPVRAQEFNEEMARTFEGIGARLQLDNEVVKIAEIIPGGPAFKAKTIQANDRIIGVAQGKDGEFEDVIGWRLDNVVSKIKGPKGTTVRLKVIPAGQELTSSPKIISLVRDKIVLQDQSAKKTIKTVNSDGKTYRIGVITIPGFYADWKAAQAGDPNYKSTTRDVKLLLDTLKQQKVDAVLVDLRQNGGGSLPEAISLTGLFIPKGPVVQTRDTRNAVEVDEDEDPSITWNGPLGVMVDRFSASASEIFAGAIQDYGRGLIIGTQTYGKGSVQSAVNMNRVLSATDKLMLLAARKDPKNKNMVVGSDDAPYGQINFTTAKFYRINGSSTQHKGVMPDIQFPMIFPADKFGESSEPSAMPWDTIQSSTFTPYANLSGVIPSLESMHEKRMKASPEYQYLLDDISEFNKREKETSVTLNQSQLKKEREEQDEKTLARDNARRKLKGLPPLKKGEARPKNDIDFVEDESLNVMADFIKASANNQLTNKPAQKF
ncbi:carboxy terminal-processing peptidase [Hufsiella arboris]|nr:carboxy terminal-processing peptidase [Hufsiella arboris]